MHEPPPEAYGRVTNPERFRDLWPVADSALVDLSRRYEVTRTEGVDQDPELAGRGMGDHARIVRLQPSAASAAPIVVAFTRFPGLLVRFGRWHVEAYPICGCDACDEQPALLADQFLRDVDDVVAGRFSESFSLNPEPRLRYEFHGRGGGTNLWEDDLRNMGDAADVTWLPWLAVV